MKALSKIFNTVFYISGKTNRPIEFFFVELQLPRSSDPLYLNNLIIITVFTKMVNKSKKYMLLGLQYIYG